MAYDEGLAERIRESLRPHPEVTEKKMFGGLAFMYRGYMFVGVIGELLMARVGPENYEQSVAKDNVRAMDFTGRPMKGYVYVELPGFESDSDLEQWVELCRRFVQSLPPKGPGD